MHNCKQFITWSTFVAAVTAAAGMSLAQPAGVTITDLGNFAGSASTVQSQLVTITPAAPVA
ncbi:MAG: hypothetical protein ACK5P8_04605, partial [Phycisphaerae bacterium]